MSLIAPIKNISSVKNFCLQIQDAYSQDVALFFRYLEKRNETFTPASIQSFKEHLISQGLAVSTINKKVSGLKNRVRLLLEKNLMHLTATERYEIESMLANTKLLKIQSKGIDAEKIITQEECRLLVRGKTKTALIIRFLSETGLRVSEMIGIKQSDITESEQYYIVRILGKGSKERIIKIGKSLYNDVMMQYNGTVYLFESSSGSPLNRINITTSIRIMSRRKIGKPISAHVLRHYFATQMIKRTHKIKAVSDYLGHSSTSITMDMYNHESLTWQDIDENTIW